MPGRVGGLVGPERLEQLVLAHRLGGPDEQESHDPLRDPAAPRAVLDHPRPAPHAEAAEQLDPQRGRVGAQPPGRGDGCRRHGRIGVVAQLVQATGELGAPRSGRQADRGVAHGGQRMGGERHDRLAVGIDVRATGASDVLGRQGAALECRPHRRLELAPQPPQDRGGRVARPLPNGRELRHGRVVVALRPEEPGAQGKEQGPGVATRVAGIVRVEDRQRVVDQPVRLGRQAHVEQDRDDVHHHAVAVDQRAGLRDAPPRARRPRARRPRRRAGRRSARCRPRPRRRASRPLAPSFAGPAPPPPPACGPRVPAGSPATCGRGR